ncbi:hypothetical protein [Brucella gallinifaecis]|nr:hypothetical protein [Brucella gallinifaecis]
MSFPVSTVKALVSGIGIEALAHARKLPFKDWTNELICLGHLIEN